MRELLRHVRISKFCAGAELVEAGVDFLPGQRSKTIHAELFAAKTAQHGSIYHSAAEFFIIHVARFQIEPLLSKISDEAASKAIARAGGIEDFFQQITRHHEVLAAMEQDGAILTALDHQRVRTHIDNLGSRTLQIVFTR